MICSSSMRRSSRGTPGREKEARLADVDREAAGGADRVVEHLGAGGQHRLLRLLGGITRLRRAKYDFHRAEPFLAEDELDAGGLRGDLLRQIVDRRTEPAVDDDGVGALARKLEREQQVVAIVADRRLPRHREPEILQLLADVAEIGVDDLAGEHLVAGADDFDTHAVTREKKVGSPQSNSVSDLPADTRPKERR